MAHFKKPTRIVLKVIFPRVVRTFVRLAIADGTVVRVVASETQNPRFASP